MLKRLFGRSTALHDAHALYGRVVTRARDPELFRAFHVPDTFDGRFEMLVVHLFLLHNRLKDEDKVARETSQCVFDCFIDDMDAALREAAVGDQTVPKRINKMTRVFYGRTGAFETALNADDREGALAEVLSRNLEPEAEQRADRTEFARYMLAEMRKLQALDRDRIVKRADIFADEGSLSDG